MGTAGVGVPLRELGVVLLTSLVFAYLTTGIVRSLVIRSGHLSDIRERDVHTVRKPVSYTHLTLPMSDLV